MFCMKGFVSSVSGKEAPRVLHEAVRVFSKRPEGHCVFCMTGFVSSVAYKKKRPEGRSVLSRKEFMFSVGGLRGALWLA